MLKGDIVNAAYSLLRISGLTVDPQPEEVTLATQKLDDMLSEWEEINNMCLGYSFEDFPDPGTESGLPKYANHAVKTNLAVRLVPDFNKQVPQTLYAQAAGSYSALSSKALQVNRTQYPQRMPRGSGNTKYIPYNRFFRKTENAPAECSTYNQQVNNIKAYSINWTPIINDNTITVSSFFLEVQKISGSATVLSQTLTDNTTEFRLRADAIGYVKIIVKVALSNGDPDSRVINVNVTQTEVYP